ncbi:MAG: carbon-nitrogen hydrolase [Wenzhouxiangella sp.]|nr:carbon-nitrogen hydrolase [Wenzhouxiangella sp.]
MMDNKLTVALAQHAMVDEAETNITTSLDWVAQAADAGARLVVLPELHRHRYFCKSQTRAFFDWAEPLQGPTLQALSSAAKAHGVVIVGSIFESRQAGLASNTAIVVESDGSLAGVYRKMHIPDDPGYNEKYYFSPGDGGFQPIDTSVGRLGVLVCWDQWFPEAARLMALAGAEVLIYPTAIGWDPSDDETEQQRQLNAWQIMHQAHAIANGLPVIACNRVGYEDDPAGQYPAHFWGHSLIVGQQGEPLAPTLGTDPGLMHAQVDPGRTATIRQQWPFLRDRRVDAYQGLTQRSLEQPK